MTSAQFCVVSPKRLAQRILPLNTIAGEKIVIDEDLPEMSLAELRSRFCDTWRRNRTDEEFMRFIQDLVSDKQYVPHNHRLSNDRFLYTRHLCALKPGDRWYEVNADTLYKLTP
jgi:predicted ArsR family transcriptional regulator